MTSVIFAIILSCLLLFAFILKVIKVNFSKRINIVMCSVLPMTMLCMFIAMFIECGLRRTNDIKKMDEMIAILDKTLRYNKVFESNKDKYSCLDSLQKFRFMIDEISQKDSIISIIWGNSSKMNMRINQVRQAVSSQSKRIGRLNDYLDKVMTIDSVNLVNNIHVQKQLTLGENTMNIIFSCREDNADIAATQVSVITGDSVVYTKQYIYKNVNSVCIPQKLEMEEKIEIGYIKIVNGKYIYNYNIWRKNN